MVPCRTAGFCRSCATARPHPRSDHDLKRRYRREGTFCTDHDHRRRVGGRGNAAVWKKRRSADGWVDSSKRAWIRASTLPPSTHFASAFGALRARGEGGLRVARLFYDLSRHRSGARSKATTELPIIPIPSPRIVVVVWRSVAIVGSVVGVTVAVPIIGRNNRATDDRTTTEAGPKTQPQSSAPHHFDVGSGRISDR